jgi:hypothetical protein
MNLARPVMLLLMVAGCAPRLKLQPIVPATVSVRPSATPSVRGEVCMTCVRWALPRFIPVQLRGHRYDFVNGTSIIVDRHGARRDLKSTEYSPHFLSGRPEAVVELDAQRIAWLDASGQTTLTASPLGPALATLAPPTLQEGETIARVFQTKEYLFIIGSSPSVFRSSDGGQSWELLDLGLPGYVRFDAAQQSFDKIWTLRFAPMWYLQSRDEGQTWQRSGPPPEEMQSYRAWPPPYAGDGGMDAEDDTPLAGVRFIIVGDTLVKFRVNEFRKITVVAGPISGPFEPTLVTLPASEVVHEIAIGGDGDRSVLAVVARTGQVCRLVAYRRENRHSTYVRLSPSLSDSDCRYSQGIFTQSEGSHVLASNGETVGFTLWSWFGAEPPRRIALPSDVAWSSFAFDSRHRTMWGFNHGQLWHQRLDPKTEELRPITIWNSRDAFRLPTPEADSAVHISTSAVTFDPDGTLRFVARVTERPEQFLVRIRPDGVALPVLKLPFELRRFEGAFSDVALSGRRGYTSFGWETADGGEHWTRVDTYTDADRVQCISTGCLVDDSRRIGWALPDGWSEGIAATPVVDVARRSDDKVRVRYECSPSTPAVATSSYAQCLADRTNKVHWASVTTSTDGGIGVLVHLADGETRGSALLKPNGEPVDHNTTLGCDKLGAFAIRDPHQSLRVREGARAGGPPREPCAIATYYRFSDGTAHRVNLPCRRIAPWGSSFSRGATVVVTERGLFVAIESVNAPKGKPDAWFVVADDGKIVEIPRPPTRQSASSALEHGHDLWVFSKALTDAAPNLPQVLARYDGRKWSETFWDIAPLSSLQVLDDRPILDAADSSWHFAPSSMADAGNSTRVSDSIGYFPLSLPAEPLPILHPWRSSTGAEAQSCDVTALGQPATFANPTSPLTIRAFTTQLPDEHRAFKARAHSASRCRLPA